MPDFYKSKLACITYENTAIDFRWWKRAFSGHYNIIDSRKTLIGNWVEKIIEHKTQIISNYLKEPHFLSDTMPLIITTYTDSFYTPIDVWIEDTVAPFVTENIGD